MGGKLTKNHLLKACLKHNIEVNEKTTCSYVPSMLTVIVNHDVIAKKDTTTLVNCPMCHRDLPIVYFKSLSNNKMKHCKDCRQEMGKK